jgi:hypothetical protein
LAKKTERAKKANRQKDRKTYLQIYISGVVDGNPAGAGPLRTVALPVVDEDGVARAAAVGGVAGQAGCGVPQLLLGHASVYSDP